MCFEIHHYLQNKFYLRKNYNLLLLDYLVSFKLLNVILLFEKIHLLKVVNLLSKSVLLTKSACFNLAAKFCAVNLLNLGVVIY